MTLPDHPRAFAAFVAPARAQPALWRLVAGVLVAAGAHLAVLLVLAHALGALLPGQPGPAAALAGGRTPAGAVAVLASFAGLGAGTVVAARLLHGRRAGSLFGRAPGVIAGFVAGAAVVAAVWGAVMLLPPGLEGARPAMPVALWAAWLPLALAAVLVQTGAEEVLFRGYIQSQLAARFRSPVAWALLPSLLFGIVHLDSATHGANAWLVVAATGLFGLAAADLTARTGAIGWAWGLHFANNAVALLVLAPPGPLDGLALWHTPFLPQDVAAMAPRLALDIASIAAVWGVGRALTRG